MTDGGRPSPARAAVRTVLAAGVAAAAVLGLSLTTAGLEAHRSHSAAAVAARATAVTEHAAALWQSLSDAQSAATGVGGLPSAAYAAAVAAVPTKLDALSASARTVPAVVGRVGRLHTDATRMLAALAASPRPGSGPATGDVLSGASAAVRADVADIDAVETAVAAAATAAADRSGRFVPWALGGGALAALALLAGLLGLLRQRDRAVEARDAAVTQREALLDEVARRATRDALTGLPNRLALEETLGRSLSRLRAGGGSLGLVLVDLDRFSRVNHSFGHTTGDMIITQVARRLRAAGGPDDLVARVGSDQFALVRDGLGSAHEAVSVAQRVDALLLPAFPMINGAVSLTASIGVVYVDGGSIVADSDRIEDRSGPQDVLAAADVTVRRAKAEGGARVRVFDGELAAAHRARRDEETALRDATGNGGLWVAYQPVVDLRDHSVVGAEALVRWAHPTRGQLAPHSFIGIAEESGVIHSLGRFVLRQACAQAADWNQANPDSFSVAVNCSARQITRPDFAELVADLLAEAGLDPKHLTIEVTESVLIDAFSDAGAQLDKLARLGVTLALDDFGTGYSSLTYLRRFPFDVVKLDRSFVDGLGRVDDDDAIVLGVLRLAQSMGRAVVAEGVETPEQAAKLHEWGCSFAQGYHFGRPEPADVFERRLAVPGAGR